MDNKYDTNGNLVSLGAGIHPNPDGYRIMSEAIPLNYFKTTISGIKMYLDSDCSQEESYDDTDALYPFYTLKIEDLKLGRTKTIIRYLKNVGDAQVLFAMYQQNGYNIEYKFEDEKNGSQDYIAGVLAPERSVKVIMNITPLFEDSKTSVDLYLSGRQFVQNS